MLSENEHRRMRWASRRGMLELDLVLEPFVDQVFPDLSETGRASYRRLMECEDQQLFGWFLGRERPDDPELASLVEHILEHNATRHRAR
jgi:antitoxin CptB